ncbi:hypothetical protein [Chitinasiproducens palmae]|uniref:Uncharacterized protein n=1 Tax=Chitinasiproducens palmae TaxID=1770053 RepID=A0A1H2PMQ1_9BURK|nr:hypothetical protein [Chitinasiproducens palmae]SDV47945.1 hypothetical protein SAMN05216551_10421 [Chitinasiproducens palmae]
MKAPKKRTRSYDPTRWLRRVEAGAQRRRDASTLSHEQTLDVGIACRLSLDRLRQGGDESSWHTLALAFNVSLILCERGVCESYLPEIIAGQEALMRIKKRTRTARSWAMDGAGRQAIEIALDVHEAHMEGCTQGEIRLAIREVERRMAAGDVFEESAEQQLTTPTTPAEQAVIG